MKKLIITLTAIIASMAFLTTEALAEATRLKPREDGDNYSKPRKPILSPVFCNRENNCLMIYADYTMLGEVLLVERETGAVIAEETGELSEGIMIELPEECNSVIVYVTVDNKVYWGEL
ncbi:MAG: hypothetical protein K2I18_01480 [Paramuribaculum sp.]|nr:hypothetical protein [Paramuribaculum sp.]